MREKRKKRERGEEREGGGRERDPPSIPPPLPYLLSLLSAIFLFYPSSKNCTHSYTILETLKLQTHHPILFHPSHSALPPISLLLVLGTRRCTCILSLFYSCE